MSDRLHRRVTSRVRRTARWKSALRIGIGVFALIVIFGSLQAGIDWGVEGPRAGFFPFYVGLFDPDREHRQSSFMRCRGSRREELFADWGQLRQVLSVVVPTAVYVAVIPVDRHLCRRRRC